MARRSCWKHQKRQQPEVSIPSYLGIPVHEKRVSARQGTPHILKVLTINILVGINAGDMLKVGNPAMACLLPNTRTSS